MELERCVLGYPLKFCQRLGDVFFFCSKGKKGWRKVAAQLAYEKKIPLLQLYRCKLD